MANRPETDNELFVGLITANYEHLRRYIYTLLPHEEDTKDVLQEVCLALSRKFHEFDRSRPFLPWACRFAYLKVLKFYEQQRPHTGRVHFQIAECPTCRWQPKRCSMTLSEKISHEVQALPEVIQREVLDFVEFLKTRTLHAEDEEWGRFSLTQAMHGLEGEPDLYSDADLREPRL